MSQQDQQRPPSTIIVEDTTSATIETTMGDIEEHKEGEIEMIRVPHMARTDSERVDLQLTELEMEVGVER